MRHKDCGGRVIVVEEITRNADLLRIVDGELVYDPMKAIEDIDDCYIWCIACEGKVHDDEVEED